MGIFYTATFSGVAVTAAQDAFEITAGAGCRVAIREITLGQYSDFGDAADELLSVQVLRGYTASGSGGAAVTPAPWNPYLRAAASVVERNNTTVASSGTADVLVSDAFNIRAGYQWRAVNYGVEDGKAESGLLLKPSTRMVVRITIPADELTMNGSLVFEELPKAPVS